MPSRSTIKIETHTHTLWSSVVLCESVGMAVWFWTVVAGLLITVSIRNAGADDNEKTQSCENLSSNVFGAKNDQTCFLAAKESIWNSFSSHRIVVNCTQCEIIHGETLEDVKTTWSFRNMIISIFLTVVSGKDAPKKENMMFLRFSPYRNRYITVKGSDEEIIEMRLNMGLDLYCLACLISGALLFYYARNLSSSVKFYYTSGVAVGVLASLLVVLFVLSRFVPKKPAAYSILVGGWIIGVYLMRLVWSNLQLFIVEHYVVFIGYIAISGFLSFALCYWKGPVTNQKSQHIIQWSIQLFALFLLYYSSQLRLVSIGIVTSVVFGSLILMKPDLRIISFSSFLRRYIWLTPESPKLLTEEEYRIQGEVETRKALEELREYCNSPQCSPWKTMSRINSPVKFISFMEGEDHVSDAEMTLHDAELSESDDENDSNITDDESVDLHRGPDVEITMQDGNESDIITDDESDLHKGDNGSTGDNGTSRPKIFKADPNVSEDEV